MSLDADAMCKIIASCKKSGVVEFKYGDLQISFTPGYNIKDPTIPAPGILLNAAEDPLLEKERAMDELMLSDPVAYEEALNAESISEHRSEGLL